MEQLRESPEPKKFSGIDLKKWFRRDNLIVLVLCGVLLFIIALPAKAPSGQSGKSGGEDLSWKDSYKKTGADSNVESADGKEDARWESYAAEQEKKLREMLSVVAGMGEVEVMLTFSATEELVPAKDVPTTRSNTNEEDSAGGSRIMAAFDRGDATVFSTAGGSSTPYVIKTLYPRVEGVLVVAEGAGNAEIRKSVTQIAQALFGVEAHKVVVVPRERVDK